MKTVIVLGNARSGTSMTAGILFYIGVNISHVHKPNSQNPRGAFESVAWNTVTSKIHQEINKGLDKKSIKNAYEKRIKELIEKEKSENDLVLKEAKPLIDLMSYSIIKMLFSKKTIE